MKCPLCGTNNIAGSDECESCHQDLSSLDTSIAKNRIEKVLMSDPLSRLKPRTPIAITPSTTVHDAIGLMNTKKVGCVLVTEGSKLCGILTERDILHRVLGKYRDLDHLNVSEVMTSAPVTLSEEDSLAYAVNKMSVGGYRHIPLTRGESVVGIISVRDVLDYLSNLFV